MIKQTNKQVCNINDFLKQKRSLLLYNTMSYKFEVMSECIDKFRLPRQSKQQILILTDNNNGCEFLKEKLGSSKKVNIESIESYCLKYVKAYSRIYKEEISKENNDKIFKRELLKEAKKIFENPHIQDVIRVSYARLLFDEYQVVSHLVHEVISTISKNINLHIFKVYSQFNNNKFFENFEVYKI